MSAAVADYKPASFSGENKRMRKRLPWNWPAQRYSQALGEQEKRTNPGWLCPGECRRGYERQKKLKSKNADLIVLNSLNDEGAGFGLIPTKVTFTKEWCRNSIRTKIKQELPGILLTGL
jgi:phosphopantothenoylcysteine decarboxylase/phosphopantothenate--cysteine ligase